MVWAGVSRRTSRRRRISSGCIIEDGDDILIMALTDVDEADFAAPAFYMYVYVRCWFVAHAHR